MSQVFIAYKRVDIARAEVVRQKLEALGISLFIDQHNMSSGNYVSIINQQLDAASAVLVLWTEAAAVSHPDNFVISEAARGRARGILVAVTFVKGLLDRLPVPFNTYHAFDLSDWIENEASSKHLQWQRVLKAIGEKIDRPLSELSLTIEDGSLDAKRKFLSQYPNDPFAELFAAEIATYERAAFEREIKLVRDKIARRGKSAEKTLSNYKAQFEAQLKQLRAGQEFRRPDLSTVLSDDADELRREIEHREAVRLEAEDELAMARQSLTAAQDKVAAYEGELAVLRNRALDAESSAAVKVFKLEQENTERADELGQQQKKLSALQEIADKLNGDLQHSRSEVAALAETNAKLKTDGSQTIFGPRRYLMAAAIAAAAVLSPVFLEVSGASVLRLFGIRTESPAAGGLELAARRQTELDAREERVAGRERASADKERAVVDKERSLGQKERAVEDRENSIAAKERLAADKDRPLSDRERAVGDKEKSVAAKERAVGEKEQTLATKERTVGERERAVAEKERPLSETERAVGEKEKSVAAKERAVGEKEQLLAARERVVGEREQTVAAKERPLNEREQAVGEKEKSTAAKERAAGEKEQALATKERTIGERERSVVEKERPLDEREQAVAVKERSAAAKERAAGEKEQALAAKERTIGEKERSLSDKERAVAEMERVAGEKDQAASQKDGAVAQKERAVREREAAVADKERTAGEKERTVTEKERIAAQTARAAQEKETSVAARERVVAEAERILAAKDEQRRKLEAAASPAALISACDSMTAYQYDADRPKSSGWKVDSDEILLPDALNVCQRALQAVSKKDVQADRRLRLQLGRALMATGFQEVRAGRVAEARTWLTQAEDAWTAAAKLGSGHANYILGFLYQGEIRVSGAAGSEFVVKDKQPPQAWFYYQKAADLGNPGGLTAAAFALLAPDWNESIAPQDVKEPKQQGTKYLEAALKTELPRSLFVLGVLKWEGKVFKKDQDEGLRLMSAAFCRSDAGARHFFGTAANRKPLSCDKACPDNRSLLGCPIDPDLSRAGAITTGSIR